MFARALDDALDLARRRLSFAAGASGAMHVIAVLAVAWQLPARPNAASAEAAIELTVDLVSAPTTAIATRQQAPPEVPPEVAVAVAVAQPAQPLPDVKPLAELIPPPSEPTPPPQASDFPPPPGETLEHALSSPDAPPVVASRDFALAAPQPAPPPEPPPLPQAPPPRAEPVTPAPTLAADGARATSRRKTEDDYLAQLIRKLPRVLYFPRTTEESQRGVVVTRVTVARDGRLLDIALTRSSGSPEVDRGLIDSIRKASPFAPLPADLPDSQLSVVVPISYTRQR